MNGPARDGDVYRFDQYHDGRVTHFTMDARDDDAALYEAEYVLNMNIVPKIGATGKLYRVDSGSDVLIADVGPLDFGDAR